MNKLNNLLDRLYDAVGEGDLGLGYLSDTSRLWDEIDTEMERLKNQYETILETLQKKEDALFKQITVDFNSLEQLHSLTGECAGIKFAVDLLKEIENETD